MSVYSCAELVQVSQTQRIALYRFIGEGGREGWGRGGRESLADLGG